MPVLSQIYCIRDSLFLSNRDPDLNLPFQILHQTYRNVSCALHLFDECLVPKLSPPMSSIAALLNYNTESIGTPPPLDDGCVTQIYQHSLLPPRTLQPDRVPPAEPDARRNSTQKLPALQSLRLPPYCSSFSATSVAGPQPKPQYQSSTSPLHVTSNTEISITAGAGSFDASNGAAKACPSLREDFSTTSPSLISGHEHAPLLPSSALSEQTDSIKQQHLGLENPYPVIDCETGSKNQDEKRRRNRIASRKFRQGRKDQIEELEALVERLQRERDFYYGEWSSCYDFLVHRIGSHLLPPHLRPPKQ